MGSVDGRLIPSRWTPPFDGTDQGKLFAEYAAIGRELDTDAWMFGKGTLREVFPRKFTSASVRHPLAGRMHAAARESSRLFIAIDPEADILFTSPTLRGDDIAVVTGTDAGDDYLTMLEETGISYLVVDDPTDLPAVMEALYGRFGVRRISLQGGGIIDGAMLAAGLISELSLVIYPGIDGLDSAPSIFRYPGEPDSRPASGASLELLSAETRPHGIVSLHYRFHYD